MTSAFDIRTLMLPNVPTSLKAEPLSSHDDSLDHRLEPSLQPAHSPWIPKKLTPLKQVRVFDSSRKVHRLLPIALPAPERFSLTSSSRSSCSSSSHDSSHESIISDDRQSADVRF